MGMGKRTTPLSSSGRLDSQVGHGEAKDPTHHRRPSPPASRFRLGVAIDDAMARLKARDGIPASEQAHHALTAFLTEKGLPWTQEAPAHERKTLMPPRRLMERDP